MMDSRWLLRYTVLGYKWKINIKYLLGKDLFFLYIILKLQTILIFIHLKLLSL